MNRYIAEQQFVHYEDRDDGIKVKSEGHRQKLYHYDYEQELAYYSSEENIEEFEEEAYTLSSQYTSYKPQMTDISKTWIKNNAISTTHSITAPFSRELEHLDEDLKRDYISRSPQIVLSSHHNAFQQSDEKIEYQIPKDEEEFLLNSQDSYSDLLNILNSPIHILRSKTISKDNTIRSFLSSESLIRNCQTGVPIKRKLKQKEELHLQNKAIRPTRIEDSNKISRIENLRSSNKNHTVSARGRYGHLDPDELRKIITSTYTKKNVKKVFEQKKKPIYHGAGGLAFNAFEAFTLSHLIEDEDKKRERERRKKEKENLVIVRKKKSGPSNTAEDLSDHMNGGINSSNSQSPKRRSEEPNSYPSEDEQNMFPNSSASDTNTMKGDGDSFTTMKIKAIRRARQLVLSKHFSGDDSCSSIEKEEKDEDIMTKFLEKSYILDNLVSMDSDIPSQVKKIRAGVLSNVQSDNSVLLLSDMPQSPIPSKNIETPKSMAKQNSPRTLIKANGTNQTPNLIEKIEEEELQYFREVLDKGDAETELDDEEEDDFFEARRMMQRISLLRSYCDSP